MRVGDGTSTFQYEKGDVEKTFIYLTLLKLVLAYNWFMEGGTSDALYR